MAAEPKPFEKPVCFVIGPIGQPGTDTRRHADWLLKGMIKPVLEQDEFGYRVKRADEDADPGMINNAMIFDITRAALVVADLSELNPNAFYELGIAHAAEKPVIHIAKVGTVLPFDNAGHRAIIVDIGDYDDLENGRRRLADMARAIKAPGYQVSNPITQANASFRMRESQDPRDRVVADLQATVQRISADLAQIKAAVHSPLPAYLTGGTVGPAAGSPFSLNLPGVGELSVSGFSNPGRRGERDQF